MQSRCSYSANLDDSVNTARQFRRGRVGKGPQGARFVPSIAVIDDQDRPVWTHGQAEVHGGYVVLLPDTRARYSIPPGPGLALEFSDVRDAEGVRVFATEYGLLTARQGDKPEPVTDWLEHATTIREALRLRGLVERAGQEDPAAWKEIRRATGAELRPAFENTKKHDEIRSALGRGVWTDDDLALFTVALYVSTTLTGGLWVNRVVTGVWPAPTEGQRGWTWVLSPVQTELLGHVYQQAASLVASDQQVRECAECTRLFLVTDRREIFCSRACGGRRRSREWQRRRRRKQERE
ncbi:MAG TPA: hypothetical protein VG370_33435 [Chloroflexota bacterium]|nr:hypothetical protein [Chloroflexota bacterium]